MIAKSTYDVFLEHGILLNKADNNQMRKAKRLRQALADIHDGLPGLQIFSSCKNVIGEIEGLMSDPDNPEKPLPNQMDHAYDALCYALSNYVPPAVNTRQRREPRERKNPFLGMKGI